MSNSLPLLVEEYTDTPSVFTDDHLTIIPVPIVSTSSPSAVGRKRSRSQSSTPGNDRQTLLDIVYKTYGRLSDDMHNSSEPKNRKVSQFTSLPSTTPNTTIHNYIIKFHSKRGKLDGKKANLLGARREQLGMLCRGESVTLDDGTVIRPEEVLGPEKEGNSTFIIDCPSAHYIKSLIENEQLRTFRPAYIVHLAPVEVLNNPEYKLWREQFPDAQHLSSCSNGVNKIILNGAARHTYRLNQVSPSNFPLQFCSGYSTETLNDHESIKAGYLYKIEPTRTICKSPEYEPSFDYDSLDIQQDKKLSGIPKQFWIDAKKVREEVEAIKSSSDAHDIEIVSVGSGSAMPSQYRNVSCTMIRTASYGILLDVGEGTLGQLQRMYGPHADSAVSSIKMIWISHLHADHHLGAVGIIRKWMQLVPSGNLFILGPLRFMFWMREYNEMEDICLSRISFINAEDIRSRYLHSSFNKPTPIHLDNINACFSQLSLKVVTCQVHHCPWAYGVAISHDSGWKIVYSGDSMPCSALVEIGQGADLLIHEATLEDDLKTEAVEKRHSTTSEAVEIGRQMNAKFTLLTHFSQRYPKIPRLEGEVTNIGISFDGMRFKLGESSRLEVMRKILEGLEDEEIDKGSMTRKEPKNKATMDMAT
ncbi:Ribonuclease Z 1 [Neolecta irregularis DAH-3]|uniref:ribonuclease Z n=1 Tax=Neolecta irregularis (strain DAH-3) TaxID=1198029 RepID=A0A1U7LSY1_NEOID|nr:Ribonuclease Z 1 [Neolecta irregularis DAH-3]|eukprot:OLL25693.1 Ribonuclease Z 1 [Neolecta irregularis DAH-3]